MRAAPFYPQETERLASLYSFEILDTQGEEAYDELTRLASEITGTEIALVSLVDEDRQWFKSKYGLDACETPRDLAFCAHAILAPDEPFIVEDASKDERFHDNPLVADDPAIRFYAGIPLRSPVDQMPLGTLCTISPRVLRLSNTQIEQLRLLAHQVERLLSLRRANIELRAHSAAIEAARNRAEQANEAKTRFLATISHDMRTPLNGLMGTLGMLSEILENEQQHEMAQTAETCGRVLLQLVNDTLELSKIESGTIELSDGPFSPAMLIEETAGVVRATLTGKSVELDVRIEPDTPLLLRGDAHRCQQVFLNLLSNAANYTENGCITISSRSVNNEWIVTVADTGPGIRPEDLENIFEPYTQSDSGLRSKSKGAGLGLNICKRICSLMGGNIAVSSTFGNGSTFTVSLDLPVAEAEIVLPAPFQADLPNLSVLIAEDDRVSREILISQLNRLGCDVTPTEDGHTALKELRKREFDVVFLDYNMPGKTGPEVAEAFRATEAFGQHVPIIALTARGFEDDRRTCEEAGMDRMLTKPLSHRDLEQVLQEFVANPRGAMPQPA